MPGAIVQPLQNMLQNTIENLILAENDVEGVTGHNSEEGFHLDKFWTDLNTAAERLSFDCTKICICFGKSPPPGSSETSSLLRSVEQAVICVVSVLHKLPLSLGISLHNHVKNEVLKAIQAVENLLKVVKDGKGDDVYRHSTGIVWEGCAHLEKVHLDNKAVVLMRIKEHGNMVADAFKEISEAMEGDGNGWNCLMDGSEEFETDEKWTEEDKDMIGPSVNLIKAAKILHKRLLGAIEKNGLSNSIDTRKELDKLHEECGLVSSQVDVLVQELYPPLTLSTLEKESHDLACRLHTVLKTSVQSHVIGETEQPHIEFLQKAIDHNLDCMKDKLNKR